VITIRDEEIGDESTERKRKKGKNQLKRRSDLGVQVRTIVINKGRK
jgi:hypothetical protein